MNKNLYGNFNGNSYGEMLNSYRKVTRNILLVWHIMCILLYTAFSIVVIVKDYGSVYTNILLVLLILYVLIYVAITIIDYVSAINRNKQAKNVSGKLKDATIVINVFKQVLNIFNLVMSIMAFVSSFQIKKLANVFSIFVAVISIIIAVIIIMFNILKLVLKYYAKHKLSNIQNMMSMFYANQTQNKNEKENDK